MSGWSLVRSSTPTASVSNSIDAAGGKPGRDEILHDLGLRPDRHGAATGQVNEVDVVSLAGELEIDAAVLEPVPVHPRSEADLTQQLSRACLDDARALPRFDVGPVAALQHDRVNTRAREQM